MFALIDAYYFNSMNRYVFFILHSTAGLVVGWWFFEERWASVRRNRLFVYMERGDDRYSPVLEDRYAGYRASLRTYTAIMEPMLWGSLLMTIAVVLYWFGGLNHPMNVWRATA
jgi:hypothetical protein